MSQLLRCRNCMTDFDSWVRRRERGVGESLEMEFLAAGRGGTGPKVGRVDS